jgi:hypothetical protein
MKAILCTILLLGIAACAGCTSPDTLPPAATTNPHLTGNWTGSLQGSVEGTGYIESPYGNLTLRITEQKDRIFFGQLSIAEANGSVSTRQLSGAISRDGKTFTIVQYDSGYDLGTVVSGDEIELVYMNDNHPAAIVIDSFRRTP